MARKRGVHFTGGRNISHTLLISLCLFVVTLLVGGLLLQFLSFTGFAVFKDKPIVTLPSTSLGKEIVVEGLFSAGHWDPIPGGRDGGPPEFFVVQSEQEYYELQFKNDPTEFKQALSEGDVFVRVKGRSTQSNSKKKIAVDEISFASSSSIVGFELVNTKTNTVLMPLTAGSTITLSQTGRDLAIRASVVPSTVNNVKFVYDSSKFTDSTIPYQYVVSAVSGMHTVSATPYTSKSAKTAGSSLSVSFSIVDDLPKEQAPLAPVLTGSSSGSSQVNLAWSDLPNEASYTLERSLSAASGFSVIATLGANVVLHTDSGLNSGTTYYYRIKASNSAGSSEYSAVVSVTTAQETVPASPTNLVGAVDSPYQVSLSWTDGSTNEQGFMVERSLLSGSFSVIATVGANVQSYKDASVSAGSSYSYRVKSYNAVGASVYSNDVSVTTSAALGTYSLTAVPQLSNKPLASAKLYLDFDGDPARTWSGYSLPATPAYDTDGDVLTFSSTELANIQNIWSRVSEKYSGLQVDVTTIHPGSFADKRGMQVVIGGSGSWTGGTYGGVAMSGSFYNTASNAVFSFENNLGNGNVKYVAESIAHESGHSFGLNHQSTYDSTGTRTQAYNTGNSLKAPIMGNSYSAARGLWWRGTSNSATTIQDDVAVLSGTTNGFGYAVDDHGNGVSSATPLSVSGMSVSGSGVIGTLSDVDVFSFSTQGVVSLQGKVVVNGPTLDLKLQLLNGAGGVVAVSDTTTLGESISMTVPAGTYYLAVSSHAAYGDLGQYTISGSVS
ncbi:MAG TPA: pre-peptidase C-terminal domain-containing protein [Candidatus Nanoarchaeia archaeon]|nr:pre-peptidase C-terminal domain-containing protein [Candidatus Nanoarchaeia archaeon]